MSPALIKLQSLVGTTIEKVYKAESGDESFVLQLSNGSILDVGYSYCEGNTELNGEILDFDVDEEE